MFLDIQDNEREQLDTINRVVQNRADENGTDYAVEFAEFLEENGLGYETSVSELYENAFGLVAA